MMIQCAMIFREIAYHVRKNKMIKVYEERNKVEWQTQRAGFKIN